MRMYLGRAAAGSFRLQKPYITLALSKVSVTSARPPPAQDRTNTNTFTSEMVARIYRVVAMVVRIKVSGD